MTKRITLAALLAMALALPACNGEDAPPKDNGTATAVALPATLFVDAAPDGALDVTEVKKSTKEGDVVIVRGKVAGGDKPFVAGRAALMLGSDVSIESCDVMGDGCETPWDYCCMTQEAIVAGTLTLQVVGADGRPLKATLDGAGGMKELSVLIVKGTVGPRPDPGVLVVNATEIYVED